MCGIIKSCRKNNHIAEENVNYESPLFHQQFPKVKIHSHDVRRSYLAPNLDMSELPNRPHTRLERLSFRRGVKLENSSDCAASRVVGGRGRRRKVNWLHHSIFMESLWCDSSPFPPPPRFCISSCRALFYRTWGELARARTSGVRNLSKLNTILVLLVLRPPLVLPF